MGEEIAFEDVTVASVVPDRQPTSGRTSQSSGDLLGAATNLNASRLTGSRPPPGSPGGSLGSSSAVSRGSEAARSVKSTRSGPQL
jgi:hypothetical protein